MYHTLDQISGHRAGGGGDQGEPGHPFDFGLGPHPRLGGHGVHAPQGQPTSVFGGERVAGWPLDRASYHLETSVPGIFVAGDVRAESAKRVASAVGEGAMAVMLVHRYLERA